MRHKFENSLGDCHALGMAGKCLLASVWLLSMAACGNAQQPAYTPRQQALRAEIGEMLLVGFQGVDVDSNHHIARDIRDYHVGGVILFEYSVPSSGRPRNIASPQQLRRLCAQLQGLRAEPLLIGIDQEGGRVNRLRSQYGFPRFASAEEASKGGPDSVRHYARLTAQTLHSMGINLNFAPCVDVNVNPQCPVIGKLGRSFSSRPRRVARCAAIWVEEHRKQHIISCPKHFPGHGSSSKDSHVGFVDVSDSWQAYELRPYKELIARGLCDMVMTTHVFNAQLDSLWPATLSPATLTTLLRDSLGFQGVVITDDLAMGAMTKQYEYGEVLRRAILAGADMLCLSNNGMEYQPDMVPQTVDLIFQMVERGEIPEGRIHQSAHRIKALKEKL